MSTLQNLQTLAADLNREERAQDARNALGRAIPRLRREKRSSRRTAGLSARFRARVTLLTLWATRNAPAIRETARSLKGSALNYGGAVLIAYGGWLITEPAGFIVGGLLAWVLHWNAEQERARIAGREYAGPATAHNQTQTRR